MSQSLLEELELADGIAQSGLDACRQGHSLTVTTPYNGTTTMRMLIILCRFRFYRTNVSKLGGGWICDLCRLPGQRESNHCPICRFDLCDRYILKAKYLEKKELLVWN
jgi:hypothetical protein